MSTEGAVTWRVGGWARVYMGVGCESRGSVSTPEKELSFDEGCGGGPCRDVTGGGCDGAASTWGADDSSFCPICQLSALVGRYDTLLLGPTQHLALTPPSPLNRRHTLCRPATRPSRAPSSVLCVASLLCVCSSFGCPATGRRARGPVISG
jgi:hypothetical protein